MAARPVRHVEAQREHPEIDELSPARAQRGDRAAQTALVERYQRPVFALLSRMVGRERAEVGDLAQETFLRALRALSRFSVYGPARLSTWLMTFATRLAVDHLRRTTPRVDEVTAAGGLPGALPWPDQDAQCRALAVALTEAVETLGPQLRAAFLLREVHGLAYDEIARTLEIEAGTATSRLARARAALQEALAGMHAENSVDEKSLIDDLWPALEPPGDFSARVVGALDGTASSAVPARRPRRALGVLAAVGVAAMVSVRWGPTGSAARDRWRARPRASRPRAESRCIGGWRWLSPARSWSGRAAPQACVSSSGAARLSTASRRAPRSWWRRAWVSPCHWHPLPGRPRQGGLGQRLRGLGRCRTAPAAGTWRPARARASSLDGSPRSCAAIRRPSSFRIAIGCGSSSGRARGATAGGGGARRVTRGKFLDFTGEGRQARCDFRCARPRNLIGHGPPDLGRGFGLDERERAAVAQIMEDQRNQFVEELRSIYVEVVGDRGMATRLSPIALVDEITAKARPGEDEEARQRRLCEEWAGRATPPSDAGRPAVERFWRLVSGAPRAVHRAALRGGRPRSRARHSSRLGAAQGSLRPLRDALIDRRPRPVCSTRMSAISGRSRGRVDRATSGEVGPAGAGVGGAGSLHLAVLPPHLARARRGGLRLPPRLARTW